MPAPITIRDVETAVREYFNIDRGKFLSNSRNRAIARPRQIAMYLARQMTVASYPQIGTHFYRDHTTVLHACRTIERMRSDNLLVSAYVSECEARIREKGGWMAQAARTIAEQPLVWKAEAA